MRGCLVAERLCARLGCESARDARGERLPHLNLGVAADGRVPMVDTALVSNKHPRRNLITSQGCF